MEDKLAKAFNEWLRRFIETPEEYSREFETVNEYLGDIAENSEPRYGTECANYIRKLMTEV